jgi:SAM-dependent methyltransferase
LPVKPVPASGEVLPTRWGEREIRGPVHLFRERLLMRLFCRLLPLGANLGDGGGPKVIEAGCGSGSLMVDLCRAGYRVKGVEDSVEFVESVGRRLEALGLQDRASVRQGNITQLDFGDGEADGLVCGEVLEHVLPGDGGDSAAVSQFHRVLKPGGICVASVPLNPKLWDHSDEWARHVKRYDSAEFSSLFAAAGFEVLTVRYWGFPLGRLYHRLLFAPWLKKTAGRPVEESEARRDTRIAGNEKLVRLAATVLRADELFGRWPWGRGIVLGCRRL